MTENDAPRSGSRWEPLTGDGAHHLVDPAAADQPAEPPATGPRRTGRARRGLLAGAGAGILVIGGVGGLAAGHAFAGTGGSSPAGVQGGTPGKTGLGEVPGDGDGHFDHHDGFGDRVDGVPPGGGAAPAAPSAGNGGTPGGNA